MLLYYSSLIGKLCEETVCKSDNLETGHCETMTFKTKNAATNECFNTKFLRHFSKFYKINAFKSNLPCVSAAPMARHPSAVP